MICSDASASPTADARRIERAGDPAGALRLLRSRLRAHAFGPDDLHAVGRLAARLLPLPGAGLEHQRVLVLGQYTTSWLSNTIMATGLQRDVPCLCIDGPYDNVLQALQALPPHGAGALVTDVLVLLPWHQRLFMDGAQEDDERIAGELAFWQQAWRLAAARGISRIVQVGYDWIGPGAQGYHLATSAGGQVDLVRRVNQALRAAMPAGAYFVPLEEVSGTLGRRAFYDARSEHWIRQPLSPEGVRLLAEHVVAGMRALLTGPRKLLILDLDNTLWGGIVGETGSLGIELGESPQGQAFRHFQRYLRSLAQRGVLLAVCSKNNDADAREPFRSNPDMVLGLDDFAHFVASWDTKTAGIERIAADLRLGLDSIVFFDDNPFERDMIRTTLPQVEVVDVPADPAYYIDALQAGLWFESCPLTDEDRKRSNLYATEAQRRASHAAVGSVDDYLDSLAMRADVRAIDEADLQRVLQLLAKTNQFNLTTRRYGADDLRRLLGVPGSVALSLRLTDRYADHGLVGVAIGVPDQAGAIACLRIDTFLMSCRVIGRTAEVYLLDALLRRAAALGHALAVGAFIPSAKNQNVASFYGTMGFVPQASAGDGVLRFSATLPHAHQVRCFIHGAS